MVTYDELFLFCDILVGIITLVVVLSSKKK